MTKIFLYAVFCAVGILLFQSKSLDLETAALFSVSYLVLSGFIISIIAGTYFLSSLSLAKHLTVFTILYFVHIGIFSYLIEAGMFITVPGAVYGLFFVYLIEYLGRQFTR
jgi:hypothetical protein|tara:strand:- start:57 stop:386 length:330 start_codon:yes stop_codon:yes gene_type:complete